MLQGQEHAHVAGTGVERTDKGDDQQRPKRGQAREAHPRGDHQDRSAKQQPVGRKPMTPRTHGKRRQRRAQHRGGAHDADLQGVQADRQQIGRQKHGHVAVAERTQRPRYQQERGFGVNPLWQEPASHWTVSYG